MGRRTIKIETNKAGCPYENKTYIINGIEEGSPQSTEGSDSEEEIEFEGWIEFVSKKDMKNSTKNEKEKTKKQTNANKTEANSRESNRRSCINRNISVSRHSRTNSRSENNENGNENNNRNNGNKKHSKDEGKGTVYFRSDNRGKKRDRIIGQIHAQIQSPVQVQTQTQTQTHIPMNVPMQVPMQIHAPVQTSIQAPVQYIQQQQQQQQQPSGIVGNITFQQNQQHVIQSPSQQPIQQMQVVHSHTGQPAGTEIPNTIMMDAIPPLVLTNEPIHSPVYVRQSPTVVVSNQARPPLVINPPPANVIFKNESTQPIYVNNPRPNVIIKNDSANVQTPPDLERFPIQVNCVNSIADPGSSNIVVQKGKTDVGHVIRGAGGGGGGNTHVFDPHNLATATTATVTANNNHNVYSAKPNGTSNVMQNDLMQTANPFTSRNMQHHMQMQPHMQMQHHMQMQPHMQMPNVVSMNNVGVGVGIGNNPSVPYPKQSQPCLQNTYSILSPSNLMGKQSSGLFNGYDTNVIQHDIHPMHQSQEFFLNQSQPFIQPTSMIRMVQTPSMDQMTFPSSPQVIHMPMMNPMNHMIPTIQAMPPREIEPQFCFEDNFIVPSANETLMANSTNPLVMQNSFMQPSYIPLPTQMHMTTIPPMGCSMPSMIMPSSQPYNVRSGPAHTLNAHKMHAIPQGFHLMNPCSVRKGSCVNGADMNPTGKKVEVMIKPPYGSCMPCSNGYR